MCVPRMEDDLAESAQFKPVIELVELNPYGMLQVGLAG
jgi:hypothetical protein